MPATKSVAIGTKESKLEFVVGQPFDEGHVCTAAEAKALNQIRAENIGNNWRSRVQATIAGEKDALSENDLRQAFAKYDDEYVITVGSVGSGKAQLTPLERECRRIAKGLVIAQLAKTSEAHPNGRKQKDIDPEAFEAQIARFAEHEQVLKLAKKNLKEQENLANINLGVAEGESIAA